MVTRVLVSFITTLWTILSLFTSSTCEGDGDSTFWENRREKDIWECGSDTLKSKLIIKQDSLSELYSETIWGSLPGCPPCWWCQGYKSGCTPRGGPSSLPGCRKKKGWMYGGAFKTKAWSFWEKEKTMEVAEALREPPAYLVELFQQPQCGNKIAFVRDGDKQRLASS